MIFDATFLARLYLEEEGSEQVRAVALSSDVITSSILAKMETEAVFHRHLRERKINSRVLEGCNVQFAGDQDDEILRWIPLSPSVIERVHHAFLHLPATAYLRAGDAIHLATAAEAGFKEIYSNDRHLLAAAPLFKLRGVNPLAK